MSDINLEDLDIFHDAIYDSTKIDLPNDRLVLALNFLPTEIKEIGERWGFNDTEFGDQVFSFFEIPENKQLIHKLVDH